METCYDGRYLHARMDASARAVWMTRTDERGDTEEHLGEITNLEAVLEAVDERWRLVYDTRQVMGRNDPDFETRLVPAFTTMARRFGDVAVLVASEIGQLQAERLIKAVGMHWSIVRDDDEAQAFLERGSGEVEA